MDSTTIKAIQRSIKHWKDMRVTGPKMDDHDYGPNARNCALCRMFYAGGRRCAGCPVKMKTGLRDCRDTPFHAAWGAWCDLYYAMDQHIGKWRSQEREGDYPGYRGDSLRNWRRAAAAEIKFLESLLPTTK